MREGIVLLVLGAAIGIFGTLLGMKESFDAIESQQASTPAELARGVDHAFWAPVCGGIVGLSGLALIALGAWRLRDPWGSDSSLDG